MLIDLDKKIKKDDTMKIKNKNNENKKTEIDRKEKQAQKIETKGKFVLFTFLGSTPVPFHFHFLKKHRCAFYFLEALLWEACVRINVTGFLLCN